MLIIGRLAPPAVVHRMLEDIYLLLKYNLSLYVLSAVQSVSHHSLHGAELSNKEFYIECNLTKHDAFHENAFTKIAPSSNGTNTSMLETCQLLKTRL